jgi:hypothetical protein
MWIDLGQKDICDGWVCDGFKLDDGRQYSHPKCKLLCGEEEIAIIEMHYNMSFRNSGTFELHGYHYSVPRKIQYGRVIMDCDLRKLIDERQPDMIMVGDNISLRNGTTWGEIEKILYREIGCICDPERKNWNSHEAIDAIVPHSEFRVYDFGFQNITSIDDVPDKIAKRSGDNCCINDTKPKVVSCSELGRHVSKHRYGFILDGKKYVFDHTTINKSRKTFGCVEKLEQHNENFSTANRTRFSRIPPAITVEIVQIYRRIRYPNVVWG